MTLLKCLRVRTKKNVKKENKNIKKVILDEREGLIERIDRVLVTKDGKQFFESGIKIFIQ